MRSLISITISSALTATMLVSNTPSKGPEKKVYLTDTSGKPLDSVIFDAYGNSQFNIPKGGVYQIQMREGKTVLYNKRALLNPGKTLVHIPDVDREVEMNVKEFRGAIMSRKEPSVKYLRSSEVDDIPMVTESLDMMAAPTTEVVPVTGSTVKRTERSSDFEIEKKKIISEEKPKAETLTAGIWNDLENWERFQTTLKEEQTNLGVWNWKLHGRRFAVEVTDKNGDPAISIPVQLRNESSIFWQGITDNRGFAELWYAPFLKEVPSKLETLNLYANYGERGWVNLGKVSDKGETRNFFRLNKKTDIPKAVDIGFVIDATGSMGDEINYLKAELMELMLRSNAFAPCSELKLASVFYRDHGDVYLSKSAPFTARYEDAVGFVQEQNAGGGGDFPEAVNKGLEESINKLTWSDKALARICFLVLDAPPHERDKAEMERLITQYAQRGIKIIPVAASGIDKPTEFLLKQMSAITGGDYIYITDHSGVGNSHLKPSGVESNVDLLINQMEKVIRKYTQMKDCDTEPKPYQPEPRTDIFGDDQIIIQSFPNPANSFINIHSNIKIDQVHLVSLNGQILLEIKDIQEDRYRLDVRSVPKGMYVLRVQTKQQTYTNKVLILNSPRQD